MDMAARMVTTMGIDMTATPAEQLLILQNWFSPAFPIGAFSYSGGLETAIARGAVHDRDSLTDWLKADTEHRPDGFSADIEAFVPVRAIKNRHKCVTLAFAAADKFTPV